MKHEFEGGITAESHDVLATFRIPLGFSEAELIFRGEKLETEDFDALGEFIEYCKKQYARRGVPKPPEATATAAAFPPNNPA